MKKINLNKSLCIGCGACVAIASEYFDFDDNGLSNIIKPLEGEAPEEVLEALSSCPTNAITLVEEESSEPSQKEMANITENSANEENVSTTEDNNDVNE